MSVVTRFAPSPTGRLHLGHAYSALKAHDFARERDGSFLLRIEDIDPTRCREELVEGVVEDLHWLGIEWDEPMVRQSQRLDLYRSALERLREQGLLYPCFCTRADIAASAAAPHGAEGPVYPGTCRRLSDDERAEKVASLPHAWRLDMGRSFSLFPREGGGPAECDLGSRLRGSAPEQLTWWNDSKKTVARPEQFGDVVLARKDAPASYHLAVTVDDAAQGITDVVRGADLFAATHVHRLLQALLGLPTPHYHHHPLLVGPDGERLAKRHGAPTLQALRENGVDGRTIADALRRGELPAGYSSARA